MQYFLNHPQRLGGPGMIVDTDKSLFTRRKYNFGHAVAEQWIMGGYDIQTMHGCLVPVPRRDTGTLVPIIVD